MFNLSSHDYNGEDIIQNNFQRELKASQILLDPHTFVLKIMDTCRNIYLGFFFFFKKKKMGWGILGKKKRRVKVVELPQFESLGGVKCHI
jgi:hypothetical protein